LLSSADLSLNKYEEHLPVAMHLTFSQTDVMSIWQLDKEENKSLSVSGLCDQSSCAVGTVV
jgi:hypothetical protein